MFRDYFTRLPVKKKNTPQRIRRRVLTTPRKITFSVFYDNRDESFP